MSMSKYGQIAELIKRRVEQGEYSLASLPGARKLAKEINCSYMTARQALSTLLADGTIVKMENGRFETKASPRKKTSSFRIVSIRPAWDNSIWDRLIYLEAQREGCIYRKVHYSYPDDPVIFEALDGYDDLIFMHVGSENELLLSKIEKNKNKVVVLFQDMTDIGVRCIGGVPPSEMRLVVKHLIQLGHKRVDCLNSEPQNRAVMERLRQWELAKEEFGIEGEIFDLHTELFDQPFVKAKEFIDGILESGHLKSTAIFCVTSDAAIGAMRSLKNHGFKIPEDISICCIGDEDKSKIAIPSITTVGVPGHDAEIKAVFDFFLRNVGDPKRLVYRPASGVLYPGESTGPAKIRET